MILGALMLGELLHRGRRSRVALAEFGQCRAGLFGVAKRGKCLPEAHHALRRPRRLGIVCRDLQILFGRLARARALKVGLADVEDGVRGQAMRRVGGEKRLEPNFRLRVLHRLKGLERGVELLSRLIEHRHPGADDCRSGRGGGGPLPSSRGAPAVGVSRTSGALGVVVPSGRGAPGAFGSALGSNASDRLGRGGTPGSAGVKGASATSESGGAPPERSPKRNSTSWRNFCSCASSRRWTFSNSSIRPLAWRSSSSSRLTRITSPAASLGSPAPPGMSAGGAAWWWKRSN